MSVTLTGKVLKVSKVKDYGSPSNFGKTWDYDFKFYMQIESKEHGIVNAMVQVKAEQTKYGYNILEEEHRQKPLIGDTVKITTHRLKENGNNDKWASVTWKQSFDIIKESKKARKDRDKWIEQKKQEREDERLKIKAENQQKNLEAKLERLGHLETQKHDERLPESVKEVINKTFNFDTILGILRDTVWFVTPEGEGGETCPHYPPCGCGHPGTGLRRPGGALYGHPVSVRTSILKKAMESGLIIETEDGYKATELGVKTLYAIDQCPDCGELRMPFNVTVIYTNPASRYTQRTDVGIRYYCRHEIQQTRGASRGSNIGTIFQELKSSEKKLERLIKIAEGN